MEDRKVLQEKLSDNIEAQNGPTKAKESMANEFLAQGKFKRALKEFQELYEDLNKQYGQHDDKTLNAKRDVANTLYKMERIDEALKMLWELLKIRQLKSGENHASTVTIKNHIASILMNEERWQEAKPIIQQIYEAEKATYGENSVKTIDARSNYATILLNEGKSQEALNIFKELYDIRKTFQSENDPNVIITRCHMAKAYEQQKKYEFAIKIYENILKLNARALREDHPQIMNIQMRLAYNLQMSNKLAKALKIFQELLVRQRNVLGPRHLDALRTQFSIVAILDDQGKYTDALRNSEELLRREIEVLGSEHPMTVATRERMCLQLINFEQYDKALEQSLEVLRVRKSSLGMLDPMTMSARKTAANCYLCLNKDCDKALAILTELKKDQETLGIKDDEYTHTCLMINQIFFGRRTNEIFAAFRASRDLFTAIQNGDLASLKDLIKKGADVNTKDDNGRTLLYHAADGNQVEMVKFLLNNGSDLTQVISEDKTMLHTAASKNHVDLARVLLENVNHDELKKFIDAKTTESRSTALHIASKNGFYDMTRLLLSFGATYHLKNKEGQRPVAVAKDQVIIELLEKIEVNFEQAKAGDEKICESLKTCPFEEFLAFTNARNYDGFNIQQIAIINNQQKLVKSFQYLKVKMFRRMGHKPTFKADHFVEFLSLATSTLKKLQDNNCTLKTSLRQVRKFISTFRSFDKRILDPNILAIEDMLRLWSCTQNLASELTKQVIETSLKLFSASIYSAGKVELIGTLETLSDDEFLAVFSCQNENEYFLKDVALLNEHNEIVKQTVAMYGALNIDKN